jgi:hypothetical protein
MVFYLVLALARLTIFFENTLQRKEEYPIIAQCDFLTYRKGWT